MTYAELMKLKQIFNTHTYQINVQVIRGPKVPFRKHLETGLIKTTSDPAYEEAFELVDGIPVPYYVRKVKYKMGESRTWMGLKRLSDWILAWTNNPTPIVEMDGEKTDWFLVNVAQRRVYIYVIKEPVSNSNEATGS